MRRVSVRTRGDRRLVFSFFFFDRCPLQCLYNANKTERHSVRGASSTFTAYTTESVPESAS
jgi:hypothetical protein